MKKVITTLILGVFCSIICFAQDVRIDSIYNSSYNPSYGLISSKTVYTYDENGLKNKEELFYEIGDKWNLSKTQSFTYVNGLLVSVLQHSSQAYFQEINHYNDTLLVRKEILSSDDGTNWKASAFLTYQYNKDNRRIRESKYNNDSIEESRYEYLYDATGNVVQKKVYFLKQGKIESLLRTEYIFNANNQLISEKEFWDNNTLKKETTYEYDTNGNLTQEYEYYLFEDYFQPLHRIQYEYNTTGKPILTLHYSFDKQKGWWLSFKYVMSYDIYGNLTNKSSYLHVDYSWIPSGSDDNWIYFYSNK